MQNPLFSIVEGAADTGLFLPNVLVTSQPSPFSPSLFPPFWVFRPQYVDLNRNLLDSFAFCPFECFRSLKPSSKSLVPLELFR